MILTLFTVRRHDHGVCHQIHRTHQSEDVHDLIRIGKDWEDDELKQYYTLRMEKEVGK